MTELRAYRPKPELVRMRVIPGGLVPENAYAESQLRQKKLSVGQIVGIHVKKHRVGGFNRKVHKLGSLCAEHIEAFSGMNGHQVIKRLQLEGNIYCEEIAMNIFGFESSAWQYVRPVVEPILNLVGFTITGNGLLLMRVPQSISYDSLDQLQFEEAARQISRLISGRYWPTVTPEKILIMAELMVEE